MIINLIYMILIIHFFFFFFFFFFFVIKMSGRAGRRGLDDYGISILMMNEIMEPEEAKEIIGGSSNELKSAFHIKYSMILNLLRLEYVKPEVILESSFYQYQNRQTVPSLEKDLGNLQNQASLIKIDNEESIEEYYDIYKQLEIYKEDFKSVINHPAYILPFLQSGRLVHIKVNHQSELENAVETQDILNEYQDTSEDFGWGILVNFQKCFAQVKGSDIKSELEGNRYIIDVLLLCKPGTETEHLKPTPCEEGEKGDAIVVPCDLSSVEEISSVRVFLPKNLKNLESRNQMAKIISQVSENFPDGIPLLDPVEDLKINDDSFDQLVKVIIIFHYIYMKIIFLITRSFSFIIFFVFQYNE